MPSAFDGKNVSYAIEKIYDYIRRSGSGYDAGFASVGVRQIADVLIGLESKMRDAGMNPDESEIPWANYAVQELQKYVDGHQSKIADQTGARIYTRALQAYLDSLRRFERDLDS